MELLRVRPVRDRLVKDRTWYVGWSSFVLGPKDQKAGMEILDILYIVFPPDLSPVQMVKL